MERKIVLITGASSGFGRITAEKLAAKGFIVYGTSRKEAQNQGSITMLKMDVTDLESIKVAVEYILSEHGRIDVLINNAGIGIGGALELATEKEIAIQMDTNFMGVVNMCKVILPCMRKARNGKIINISSIGGIMGIPYQGYYSASKFAVEGFSEALALEVHSFGIKVCIVEPGDFRTEFTEHRNISEMTINSSDYGDSFKRSLKIIENEEKNGSDPILLATAICKLINQRNPSFRTLVGPQAQIIFAKAKKWLPDSWLQSILRSFYRLT